jgi:hypothetical protein
MTRAAQCTCRVKNDAGEGGFLCRRNGGKAAGCLGKPGTCSFGKNINSQPVVQLTHVNILRLLCYFICVKLHKRVSLFQVTGL